jgi:RNA polymerase sigma factor (sigma-70 family)
MAQPATPLTSDELPPSDSELIAASRAGDTTAYAMLYQRHSASAHALARSLLRGRAEADDAVAEAFTRVLAQLRRGAGPHDAFRAYLLTTVRRLAFDRFAAEQRQVSSPDLAEFDSGEPFVDPAVAGLENDLIARAYFSLPQRWRAVLWHTAVEGGKPAEIAELLGVTPNGVAALAYRAREGLRQAYLQMHLNGIARQECRPALAKLGAYVRGGLSKRDSAEVAAHVDDCADCRAAFAELHELNDALKITIGPLILGSMAVKGGLLGWIGARIGARIGWFKSAPKHQQAATAGGAAAVAAAAVALVIMLTSAHVPIPHLTPPRHPVAAPVPAPRQPASHPAPAAAHPKPPAAVPPPVSAVPVAARPRPRSHPRPVPAPVQLTASINPVGSLLRGGTGVITFTVANTGRTLERAVDAMIELPPGVSELGGGTLAMAVPSIAVPDGWSCVPEESAGRVGGSAGGARCTHGPLAAGASTTSYLQVVVAQDAQLGVAPSIQISGPGMRPVSAHGLAGVVASGLPARFAATGRFSTAVGYGSFAPCHQSSTVDLQLSGPVRWAGLYWSWLGPDDDAPITLTGPGGNPLPQTSTDVGTQTIGAWQVHQAFVNVTSLITTGGDWTAQVTDEGTARYIGWSLVVVTARSSGPSGQVMVLDGTELVVPWGNAFEVPFDGLLPSATSAGVTAVTWQLPGGAGAVTFTEPPGNSHIVTFAPGSESFVAGVLAVTSPPAALEYSERQPRARDFTTLGPRLRSQPRGVWPGQGSADLESSRAEGKDGVAWIAARCSLTRAMSCPMARWPCTGLAAVSPFPGTTAGCCSSSPASPPSASPCRCCGATGTRRRSRAAGQTSTRPSPTSQASNSG